MKLAEFLEQNTYCKEHNTPEGAGCDRCPHHSEYCADALRNLCEQLIEAFDNKPLFNRLSKELERYGITRFNQLALFQGFIEFPE